MSTRHIKFWKYFKEWATTYKYGQVSKYTWIKYEMYFKVLKENHPDVYLDEIKRSTLQGMINKYGETRNIVSVRNYCALLKSSLKDALYEGFIRKDPTYKVFATSQVYAQPKKNYLESYNQINKLVRVLKSDGSPMATMFDFDLRTGLRIGEVLGLTPKDVDKNKMTISINKTWDYKNKDGGFRGTKNRSSMRTIRIDYPTLRDLEKYSHDCTRNESIFITAISKFRGNKRFYESTEGKRLKRFCQEADVREITIHGLRHTHASMLIAAGVSIQSVAKRLGHSNTRTTQRVYIHVLDDLRARDDNAMLTVLNEL